MAKNYCCIFVKLKSIDQIVIDLWCITNKINGLFDDLFIYYKIFMFIFPSCCCCCCCCRCCCCCFSNWLMGCYIARQCRVVILDEAIARHDWVWVSFVKRKTTEIISCYKTILIPPAFCWFSMSINLSVIVICYAVLLLQTFSFDKMNSEWTELNRLKKSSVSSKWVDWMA